MKRFSVAMAALMVGGLIYLLWRHETLTMFTWVRGAGGERILDSVRLHASHFLPYLPEWALYSLPGALWLLSGLLLLDAIWGDTPSGGRAFWSILLWSVAIGGEVGQALRIVPGSFDVQDISLMIVAGGIAFLVTVVRSPRSGKHGIS